MTVEDLYLLIQRHSLAQKRGGESPPVMVRTHVDRGGDGLEETDSALDRAHFVVDTDGSAVLILEADPA